MAFYDIRFPTNISYGAAGGSGWSTRVNPSDGGYEGRVSMWTTPRGRWSVTHENRYPGEWIALISLHRVAMGRLNGFRFQDPVDYTDGGLGVVNYDANGNLRLMKRYVIKDPTGTILYPVYRIISKPQPDAANAPLTLSTLGATVNFTNGFVTGGSTATTWTGQFDVPVRFDTETPQLSYDFPEGVSWHAVELVEIPQEEIDG